MADTVYLVDELDNSRSGGIEDIGDVEIVGVEFRQKRSAGRCIERAIQ